MHYRNPKRKHGITHPSGEPEGIASAVLLAARGIDIQLRVPRLTSTVPRTRAITGIGGKLRMKIALNTIVAGLFLVLMVSCVQKEEEIKVDLEKKEVLKPQIESTGKERLRIAVGAMITPKAGFAYYKQLLEYIGETLERNIKFIDKESYAEINSLLETGGLDAAFVCSGPYVDGHKEFGLELMVVPQAYGETVYYSYIIVPSDSPAKTVEDLRGRTFAFTDPKSNTGKLVPTYILARMEETPESFFREYRFTYAHDKSIKAVALKMVDGAAVDSLIWEYADKTDPEFTSKTRIILKSSPYGIPPFVVRPGLAPETKNRLKQILLNVHKDERGKKIIKGMMIDKFVEGDNSAYDSVREMKAWVEKQKTRE
jgi:phosphonate transport system substrate-binding protein